MKTDKPVIAVVTALANGYAEKELLDGIITENAKNGCVTVVFTIIYNIVQRNNDIISEQNIYDFLQSDDISGIILLSESFVEDTIRQKIASVLQNCHVPVIGIGGQITEFRSLDFTMLNTDDRADIEKLTSHLIEEHGFTDIAFLSGMKESEISEARIDGFVSAMKNHNIEPDMNKVYYGDFWLESGKELAERYINGEIPYPQAVICANDMMAYGMLERFADAHIPIPEQLTVVSYEYTDMRCYYTPLLTSFKRNRIFLGQAAANHIFCLIANQTPPEFKPPHGDFVFGKTSPCHSEQIDTVPELKNALQRKSNNDLSLFCSMEQKLTFCHDMDEYIAVIGEFHWLIKHQKDTFLSLYSNWYDTAAERSEIIQSRSILPWSDQKVHEIHKYDLYHYFELEPEAVVCYLAPVFSGQNDFGYIALLYDHSESYEDVFRNWLKSVSVGLEFLRLKNDIRYLLSCQNISEYKDTLTGLYNLNGMKRAYSTVKQTEGKSLYLIMLRINLFPHRLNETEIQKKTEAYLGLSKILTEFCSNRNDVGRISEDVFVCLMQRKTDASRLTDLLCAMLIQEKTYMKYAGMDSFVCTAIPCADRSWDAVLDIGNQALSAAHQDIAEQRNNDAYDAMLQVRSHIYAHPETTFRKDCDNMFTDRIDYFRRNYHKLFGISFHQDCILARLVRAKYLLALSTLSLAEIAEQCGYMDEKYFQRQFSKATGITALQYRNTIFE